MRPAKAQASLRIRAISPEPSLFAHMKYGSRRRVRPKIRHQAPLDSCACVFKNEFTEDEKCHNIMSWLIFGLFSHPLGVRGCLCRGKAVTNVAINTFKLGVGYDLWLWHFLDSYLTATVNLGIFGFIFTCTVAWLFTEYGVARGILKFQCKTWKFRTTWYSVNSQAIIYEPRHEKFVFGVCDQLRLKPAC